MADKYTFGGSKAAQNLITTLSKPECSQYQRPIYSLLSKYLLSLNGIMDIRHKGTRETLLKLWYDRFEATVNGRGFPLNLTTHTLCVAKGEFRRLLAVSRT